MSVPNQLTVKIQKPQYKEKFLQIGIDEWIHAANIFPPATFKLYLYLAGNKDNFSLELSQQAVQNTIGIKKTAYHDGLNELKEAGYLKPLKGNIWSFSPRIPEEGKEKGESANANTESSLEVNISKTEETTIPMSDSLLIELEDDDFSANAYENNLSAFQESSSAFQNKSSAKTIEKQIIDNIDNKTDTMSLLDKFRNDPAYSFLYEKEFVF